MLVFIGIDYQKPRQKARQTDRLGGGNREFLLVEEAATGAYYFFLSVHSFHSTF